jgi:transcriptional regulator with XRE-family HTH domain
MSQNGSRPDALVGLRILARRTELGLSQRELTKGLDRVSYAYLSRVEAGARMPSWRALIELADRLETSALWLATGTNFGCPVCHR